MTAYPGTCASLSSCCLRGVVPADPGRGFTRVGAFHAQGRPSAQVSREIRVIVLRRLIRLTGVLRAGAVGPRRTTAPVLSGQSISWANSLAGSASRALAISMNSTTSRRRSPASSRPTNEWGLFSRDARSRWVRPAAFLALVRTAISFRCPWDRRVLRRVVRAMLRCSRKWSNERYGGSSLLSY